MRLLVAILFFVASTHVVAAEIANSTAWAKSLDEKKLVAMAEIAEKSGNSEMADYVHGQLLMVGDVKFSDPSSGIQYFMLRMNPVKPTCKKSQVEKPKNHINEFSNPATCNDKHQFYNMVMRHITPELMAYRDYEVSYFNRVILPHRK